MTSVSIDISEECTDGLRQRQRYNRREEHAVTKRVNSASSMTGKASHIVLTERPLATYLFIVRAECSRQVRFRDGEDDWEIENDVSADENVEGRTFAGSDVIVPADQRPADLFVEDVEKQ